ncbi:hypothetical protein Leryth_004675 [Lithospermum erythrorhizon]|nr:hypothetical protein Leryth_004675 [Lithospermum erythrorhizon]
MRGRESWSTSSSSSSTLRFLDNLKLPESNQDPLNHSFEFQENDIVWSTTTTLHHPLSPSSSSPPPFTPPSNLLHHRFIPTNSGLTTALSEDSLHPLLHRNSATKAIPQLKSAGGQSKFHQSAPVNIPMWPNSINKNKFMNVDKFDEDDDELDGDNEMVPPHVIVARSHAPSRCSALLQCLKAADVVSVTLFFKKQVLLIESK